MLLHLIDIDPIDGSDPVENAKIIVSELEKYSEKLAQKPRWLVFNKVDLLDAEEAKEKAKAIVEALGWDENYYMIAAINQEGVKKLCWNIMEFLNVTPREQDLVATVTEPGKVDFMWDDYHKEQLENPDFEDDDDDDWDEEDDDGIEFIYQR